MMFSEVKRPAATVDPDSDKIGVWTGNDDDNATCSPLGHEGRVLHRRAGPVSWYFGICALALFAGVMFLLVALARLSLFGARTSGEVVSDTRRMRASRGERAAHAARALRRRLTCASTPSSGAWAPKPARWPVGTSLPVAFLERGTLFACGRSPCMFSRLGIAPAALYGAAIVAYAAYTAVSSPGPNTDEKALPRKRPRARVANCSA